MCDHGLDTLVIDHGSSTCKVGFGGENSPCFSLPTVVGRRLSKNPATGLHQTDVYVGEEAQKRRDLLALRYPIDCGIVTDWDDMGEIWHHILYNELQVFPEEHPLLLTEAPLTPRAARDQMAQLVFEAFRFPAMYVANQARLALYGTGRSTGIVVDSGSKVTRAVPVYEGYTLADAVTELNVGGQDLTHYLATLLGERGCTFPASSFRTEEIVRDIKEKLSCVAYDFEQETRSPEVQSNYQLPDGRVIAVGRERFRCPEALFQPHLLGTDSPGVHRITYDSIQKCDEGIHQDLYKHTILSGGSTMFPGMAERMRKEMASLAPPAMRVSVVARPDRELSTWAAASMLAVMPSSPRHRVLRKDYEEFGPAIVHRKCF